VRGLSQHSEATARRRIGHLLTGLYPIAPWLAQAASRSGSTEIELSIATR
jgi:hypothetical protein